MKYQFIDQNRSRHRVDEMCECFGVSRSGYYAWKRRPVSGRVLADNYYKERIIKISREARGRYGHRPIYQHLQDEQIRCGRDRTLRLMKELKIAGIQRKRFKPLSTNSNHHFGYRPNLLKEFGRPEGCNQVWVADTTYLQIRSGWGYLATVMDLFSRQIIGWSVSSKNDAELVGKALQAAVLKRGGKLPPGLIHHSDRGSTYASWDYQRQLSDLGIKQSMSAKGNCYENAAMESFYGRYKCSSVRGHRFADEKEVRANAFEYIEIFYNRFRKHSALGYRNPVQFEQKFYPPWGVKTEPKRLAITITKPQN